MSGTVYSKNLAIRMARESLDRGPARLVQGIVLNETPSPWKEKIRLSLRGENREAILFLWKNDDFLAARIARLVLYLHDSLDPAFRYDGNAADALNNRPKARACHNHIWSIYVDSRIEKMGLENFFDKTLRRNLFLDLQKNYPWSLASLLFERLWEKDSFTHQEIVDYACDPAPLLAGANADSQAFEVEMNRLMEHRLAADYLGNIQSPELRKGAERIFAFVQNHCRKTLVEPSYYGVHFICEGIVFAELATRRDTTLLLSLFDPEGEEQANHLLQKDLGNLEEIEKRIKVVYERIMHHSYPAEKEAFSVPM